MNMSTTHVSFLVVAIVIFFGGIGWLINVAWSAFKNVIDTLTGLVADLRSYIALSNERYNSQTSLCQDHRKLISEQHLDFNKRVDRVEKKIDDHIEDHIAPRIIRSPQ